MLDLTHAQVLKMEAGPKLDALVVERVMGWVIEHHDDKPSHFHRTDEKSHWTWLGDWSPSTDIVAAWEVVEKLIATDKLNLFVDFTEARERGEAPPWRCCLEAATHVGEGSTAPLAISRAALLTTLTRDVTPTSSR